MSSSAWPDLSGLASLARNQSLDLRPVLLRIQTDLFVTAPARDRATVEAFEALASGLLRTVDADTAARVARKLSPCPDTPESLLSLLIMCGSEARRAVVEGAPRLPAGLSEALFEAGPDLAEALSSRPDLDGRSLDRLAGMDHDGVDFSLAMNRRIVLRGQALDLLLERALRRPALAQALLARGDLTAAEEASLYVQADGAQRARIRSRLDTAAAFRFHATVLAEGTEVAELLALSQLRDHAGFEERLAGCLGLAVVPDWRFCAPARHDLLALALVAAGVPSEAAIQIFLTLDPRIACSVHAVSDLALLARTVPQPVASSIIEATLGTFVGIRRTGRHVPAMDASGVFARAGSLSQSDRDRRVVPDRTRRTGSGS